MLYIYISYRYNIKHLYNIQIQKYIANKEIIQNYAQMKYKWPVTAISRFSVSFAILFICLFVHFLPSNVRILPLNMMNTGIESQTKRGLQVRCISCPFKLSLRRVFPGSYGSCSFLKYQYFQISIIIQLESEKSHRFASYGSMPL